jgi:site-specific recombinase XerC
VIERVGIAASMPFKCHPHQLRHACGCKLANDGHDTRSLQAYLGHRNIQNTTRYTALAVQDVLAGLISTQTVYRDLRFVSCFTFTDCRAEMACPGSPLPAALVCPQY